MSQRLHTSQKQAQTQTIAPRQMQALDVLQASVQELERLVQSQLLRNPALEEVPPASAEGDGAETASGVDDASPVPVGEGVPSQPWTAEQEKRRQHLMESHAGQETLFEHLMAQARLLTDDARILGAMEQLAGNLDEDGFLQQGLEAVALESRVPLQDLEEAHRMLVGFDPQGIGSLGLADCLARQLEASGRGGSLAHRLVRGHFDKLLRNRLPEIARAEGVDMDAMREALAELSRLERAPGRRYAHDVNTPVEPDVTMVPDGAGGWRIDMNDARLPRLRISREIKDMLSDGRLAGADRAYARGRIDDARHFIDAITSRQETLRSIAGALAEAQSGFLSEGRAALKPLTMSTLAGRLGISESTVSRAVAGKHLSCPAGVFALRELFSTGYVTESGDAVSNTAVKEALRELVAKEDPAHPLSDERLAEALQERGLSVARRTVAKYREALGIAGTHLRRRH